MKPPPSLGRCSASRLRRSAARAFPFLAALIMLAASAGHARADGAKQGGEVAGVLATESKPMEAPTPKAKTTANAKPATSAKRAKPAKAGRHVKSGGQLKAARSKPAKAAGRAAPARRGPKLRA